MLERRTERYGMMSVLLEIPWVCFELLWKEEFRCIGYFLGTIPDTQRHSKMLCISLFTVLFPSCIFVADNFWWIDLTH